MIYLDNAATTAISPAAADAADRALREYFGNPSSLYSSGLESHKSLERSRAAVAGKLGCSPQEVYFTSGGTESNNLAILGSARARKDWGDRVLVSGFEHPSVLNTVMSLQNEGFRVTVIAPEKDGTLDTGKFISEMDRATVLVTCMRVNNETGALNDVTRLAEEIKKINKRTAFHCDAVQGFGKHATILNGAIDTLSVSAHKIHGPKGIGCLYVRKGFNLETVLHGGGQERGLRSGTENIAYAAGFAKAASEIGDLKKQQEKAAALKELLRQRVEATGKAVINSPEDGSPFILNFSLPGFRSETVLHFMEEHGVLVSSGSACGKGEKSHTLTAMGIDEELIDSAVRVSFSFDTQQEDVLRAAELFELAVNTLQRKR